MTESVRYRIVEPYAGLAGVTLRALFGVDSPVSRIGNKSKYAHDVLARLVPEGGVIDRALLIDDDPCVVNFWDHLPSVPCALAVRLDGGPARDVWERARRERNEPGSEGAAAWITWTAGARGGIGGFKGAHKLRANVDGFIPSRSSLLARIERLAGSWSNVEVRFGRAEDVTFGPDDLVYIDPPYPNTQGYGSRGVASGVAQVWKNASVARRRAISGSDPDGYPIPEDRSRWIRLGRIGQKRRSLTKTDDEFILIVDTPESK